MKMTIKYKDENNKLLQTQQDIDLMDADTKTKINRLQTAAFNGVDEISNELLKLDYTEEQIQEKLYWIRLKIPQLLSNQAVLKLTTNTSKGIIVKQGAFTISVK